MRDQSFSKAPPHRSVAPITVEKGRRNERVRCRPTFHLGGTRRRTRLEWRLAEPALRATGALVAALVLSSSPSSAGLSAVGNQLWHQDVLGITGVAQSGNRFGHEVAAGDFDGDGWEDLAIGVYDEAVAGIEGGGALNVLYGGPGGLLASGNQFWSQNSSQGGNDVLDEVEEDDHFGSVLAAGDFNGDGWDDLAIGIPEEDIGSLTNAGAVAVIYGGPNRLEVAGNQFWHQDSPGILDAAELGDRFGSSLTVGDFDDDGWDDLAIGAASENIGTVETAGAVSVLYGGPGGLSATGNQFWHQNSAGILDVAESEDSFGSSLAAGDFNGDGWDDLAIGVESEGISGIGDAGAVNVLYGGPGGLSDVDNQFWHQNSPGSVDAAEELDVFGSSLAAGDFDGDGRDDLAIGVPGEDVGGVGNAGAVAVLYGDLGGLSSADSQLWHQDSPGVLDLAENADFFGSSLSAGDFDDDGRDDLAIGVDQSPILALSDGSVAVLYGDLGGLSASGNQLWHQDSPGLPGKTSPGAGFGRALAAGDFDGSGSADLAVCVPFEDPGSVMDAGAVQILYGSLFADGFESGDTSAWSAAVP